MRPTYALALCVAVAVATLSSRFGSTRVPAPAAGAAGDRTAAYRALRAATVRIDLPFGGHGSGVCRKLSDGSVWVWTVAHVTDGAKVEGHGFLPVSVVHRTYAADDRPSARTEYAGQVVRCDRSLDLALVRLSARHVPVGSLDFAATPPPVGTRLLCCGSAGGFDNTVTSGTLNYRDRRMKYGLCDQIELPVLGGSSGGPVTGPDGRVVGLIHGSIGETFAIMIPARTVRRWAADQGLLGALEGDEEPLIDPAAPVDVTPVP